MRKALLASFTVGCLSILRAPPAHAHIDLLEPEARAHGTAAFGDTDVDENSNLKNGPCGQLTTGRTDRVARYAPGQTIRVRVREENAHVSYLRVALDLDGDEFPLRTQFPGGPETQAEASAAEAALGTENLLLVYREDNDTAGFVHELEVTLPERSCDACTLQVLQYMYDDPAAPYYFQCADLVIADGASSDAGPLAPDAGAGPASPAPAAVDGRAGAGATPAPGASSSAGSPAAPGPLPGAAADSGSAGRGGGVPVAPTPSASGDGGGCSTSRPPRAAPVGVGLLPALLMSILLGLVSRRVRRHASN